MPLESLGVRNKALPLHPLIALRALRRDLRQQPLLSFLEDLDLALAKGEHLGKKNSGDD